MAMLTLPQKYLKQPQGAVELAPRYRDALFFSMLRTLSDKDIAKNNAMSANNGIAPSQSVRTWGKTLTFNGAGSNLKTASGLGAPTAFTILAWVCPSTTGLSFPYIAATDYSVGFYFGGNSSGTQYEFATAADLGTCVGGTLVAGRRDLVVATFASNTRSLYVNGVLADTATSGGINSSYGHLPLVIGANPGNTNSNGWQGDIDTIGVWPRAFSASEIKTLYNEPWTMLRQPSRNLFFTASAPSSSSTGSAAGAATVSGVGTSGTGSSGSASGNAIVTGSGASTAASSGVGNGAASVSGVGACLASTVGNAGGSATVPGVGDSSIPGATVGTASGASSVSGVGASVVSARGTASGSSSVSGVAEGAEDSLGGDDGILIYEEPKKKKKPRRRIEDILEDAVRSVVIKAEKQKPVAKPKPVKIKEIAPKEVVQTPALPDPVEQLRVAEEEAQKVSALLAQYQEQVRRREMEEDEELLMLIAMEML